MAGRLLAADDDRGSVEAGLAAGRALSGQPEDHLLDLGARGLVRFGDTRHHRRRDFVHEGEVFLRAPELHRSADLLFGHVPQAGVAKDPGHVAGRGAAEQARRAGRQRGHLDVFGDRTHDGGRPRILLGRTPHGGADTGAGFGHTGELAGCRRDVGEEHEGEAGRDRVERAVGEGKRASVALARLNVAETTTRGALLGDEEHLFGEVGHHDLALRAARGCTERRLSSPRRYVEDVGVGPQAGTVQKLHADGDEPVQPEPVRLCQPAESMSLVAGVGLGSARDVSSSLPPLSTLRPTPVHACLRRSQRAPRPRASTPLLPASSHCGNRGRTSAARMLGLSACWVFPGPSASPARSTKPFDR